MLLFSVDDLVGPFKLDLRLFFPLVFEKCKCIACLRSLLLTIQITLCKECTLYCVYKVDAVAGLKVKVTSYRFYSQQPKTFSLV